MNSPSRPTIGCQTCPAKVLLGEPHPLSICDGNRRRNGWQECRTVASQGAWRLPIEQQRIPVEVGARVRQTPTSLLSPAESPAIFLLDKGCNSRCSPPPT